jgi:Na+-driven multidrug efflux pump
MVVSQSFNGAGDTRTPTLINLFVFWVLQIPLAWTLSHHTGLGPSGVFITLAVCFSIFAVVSVALFRRGAWKRTKV